MTSEIKQAFMQFGQNLGMRDLALDENGVLSLIFDDHLLVEAQTAADIDTLFLIAAVSALPEFPEGGGSGFYQALLQAPLHHARMAGTFFAADAESEEILLIRTLAMSAVTAEILEKEIERFVNALEHWAGRVKNGVLSLDEEPRSAPGPALQGGAVRI